MNAKTSTALTLLIICIAGITGYRQQQELSRIYKEQRNLRSQAGIPDGLSGKDLRNVKRITRSHRSDKQKQVDYFLESWAALPQLKRADEQGPKGHELRRVIGLLYVMDGTQLLEVWNGLSIKRDKAGAIVLDLLATRFPEKYLELNVPIFKDLLLNEALHRIALDNPLEAQRLLLKAGLTNETDLQRMQATILQAGARKDPRLAFQILSTLSANDQIICVDSILRSDDDGRNLAEIIPLLRTFLETSKATDNSDLRKTSMNSVAYSLGQQGYEKAVTALSQAGLTEAEKVMLAGELGAYTKADTSKWIGWVETNIPPEKVAAQLEQIAAHWTDNDYRATEKWLAEAPSGSTKDAIISGYVKEMASVRPEDAARWATTHTSGTQRENLLKEIHNRWPPNDPDGRAAFALEHGFQHE